MTLQASGQISISEVNAEVGLATTYSSDLNFLNNKIVAAERPAGPNMSAFYSKAYFQNNNNIDDVFAQAMPRYEFISRRVERNSNVLNIGVGRGGLEEVLLNRRAILSCFYPNE